MINKKIAGNEDLLRQTLAHEIIHHHLYQTYGNDVAKHGEYFTLFADRINAKEGKNFVSPYADHTDFKPNGKKVNAKTLDTVVIPKGSMLFHGTLEKVSNGLRPGGDKMIWFADSPKIAQLYIPESGMTMYADADSIARPDLDLTVQKLQKMIGIDYDYSKVEWDGRRLKSFSLPKGFDHVPKEDEITKMLDKAGFKKKGNTYAIKVGKGKILKSDEKQQGELFIAKVKEPLKVWRKATGEGDLMDLQYHDLSGFEAARAAGIDGVLINDFAQSKEYGNFGHMSVGLFNTVKLDIKSIPAQYQEWGYETKGTPEYPNPPASFLHKL